LSISLFIIINYFINVSSQFIDEANVSTDFFPIFFTDLEELEISFRRYYSRWNNKCIYSQLTETELMVTKVTGEVAFKRMPKLTDITLICPSKTETTSGKTSPP